MTPVTLESALRVLARFIVEELRGGLAEVAPEVERTPAAKSVAPAATDRRARVLLVAQAALAEGRPGGEAAEDMLRALGLDDFERVTAQVLYEAGLGRVKKNACAKLRWWRNNVGLLPYSAPRTLEAAVAKLQRRAPPKWSLGALGELLPCAPPAATETGDLAKHAAELHAAAIASGQASSSYYRERIRAP